MITVKNYLLATSFFLLLAACTASKKTNEKCFVIKNESEKGLSFHRLKSQESLVNREGASRGILDAYLIPLATNGIKTLIDNRKKKYTAESAMAVKDLHFYNNLSTNGIFDPTGIVFEGFTLVRLARKKDSKELDTALIAHFVLDTTNSYEIANNSMFRLKLDSLDFRFPKAHYKSKKKGMNIDFEITFSTSFVNESGNFFTNVPLGKFYYSVRNAPFNKKDTGYARFYDSLRNGRVTGSCFIVPRSFGYYVDDLNQLKPSYSWGNYSISATVKESSKQAFVDKIIGDNSDLIINAMKSELQKGAKKIK
jgi:hypothetical protein